MSDFLVNNDTEFGMESEKVFGDVPICDNTGKQVALIVH